MDFAAALYPQMRQVHESSYNQLVKRGVFFTTIVSRSTSDKDCVRTTMPTDIYYGDVDILPGPLRAAVESLDEVQKQQVEGVIFVFSYRHITGRAFEESVICSCVFCFFFFCCVWLILFEMFKGQSGRKCVGCYLSCCTVR
jgi:hypothetical protein